jgi:hypothetical protein
MGSQGNRFQFGNQGHTGFAVVADVASESRPGVFPLDNFKSLVLSEMSCSRVIMFGAQDPEL